MKASLFEIEPFFPDNVDWNTVLTEAKGQILVALAAEAVPQELATDWRSSVLQSQTQFIRVLHGQTQLVSLFEQAEIPLVILKGTAAAFYYHEPARRAMGDIEFLVSRERFEESLRLMEKSGYRQFSNGERPAELKKDGMSTSCIITSVRMTWILKML